MLFPPFLEAMARIGDYGAARYGEFNYLKGRLTGDKSPINHIYKHLSKYQMGEMYDHPSISTGRMYHLAAIAFNAMMEFSQEFIELLEAKSPFSRAQLIEILSNAGLTSTITEETKEQEIKEEEYD